MRACIDDVLALQLLTHQPFAPGAIRTHNLLIRSQMLYPIELRVPKDRQGNAKAREVKQTGKGCFVTFVWQ
jgi:hypothetical protein